MIYLNGDRLDVLVADTPQARLSGLRGVDLADCPGMLFVYDRPVYHPFTMEGMDEALDISFFDSAGQHVGTIHMEPGQIYWPTKEFQYALECPKPLGLDGDSFLSFEGTDYARDFTPEARSKLSGSGKALPDGSFPIVTVADLKNAIQAFGRAKNQAAAKKHIIKRARSLGATSILPENWRT